MKLPQASTEVLSTMQGEKVAMGIAVEDMSHIMSILAGLYKNRLLAMIREYSTNAWDAHRDAGVSLPIEVTLPNSLSPTLTIRDYGSGLSAEDIRLVYSQYGRSTKRNTNNQVGMMGLGCKSALSYTQQFTVTSVKDNRKVTVLVALDDEGVGNMQILADTETDAANGTVVSIAIQRGDVSNCEREAEEFFKYWPSDAVLVNGKTPKRFKGLKISDDLYLVEDEQSVIVMGNVPYLHDLDLGITRSYRDPQSALIAFVPIGSVKPTPSRESLMDVKSTKETVERLQRRYKQEIKAVIQREINNCDSPHAALRLHAKWRRFVPPTNAVYTYDGEALPTQLESSIADSNGRFEAVEFRDYYGGASSQTSSRVIQGYEIPTTVWVTGYEPSKFTSNHKKKLLKWYNDADPQHGFLCERFVLLREPLIASPFIYDTMVVSWDTIKAVKLDLPAVYATSGRIPGSYDIFTETGWRTGIPGDDIRQDRPIIWAEGNRYDNSSYERALNQLYHEFTFVVLAKNRIAKFCRIVPNAKTAMDAISEAYTKWAATIPADQLKALAMHDDNVIHNYRALKTAGLTNPDFTEAVRISKLDINSLISAREKFRSYVNFQLSKPEYKHPLKDYPLFQRHLAMHPHTIRYLNEF